MLKRPETIGVWRHWFGRSLRPGKPSNSPRGAEGAAMARRVPFPPSSIPAYIEQSMKLFVCPRRSASSSNPGEFKTISAPRTSNGRTAKRNRLSILS